MTSFVSLFSGAMGLDIGLEKSGMQCLVANENDSAAVRTIKRNRPDLPVLTQGIESLNASDFIEANQQIASGLDVVTGGPPCQAFSIMGRRGGLADERGTMILEFARIVGELDPSVFVMENVRGLHSMPILPQSKADDPGDPRAMKGSLLARVIDQFESLGYRCDTFLVNSANYGAPQVRERLVMVGNKLNRVASFPGPRFSNRPEDSLPPFATLRDAIGGDFTDPDPTLMNFSERKLKYLAMVPPGGNWRSLPEHVQKEAMGKQYYLKGGRSSSWRRLSWDHPSPTVHTLPNHATTSMCHPGELRALTVGECAAIQEFPPNWDLEGTASDRYRQVGNAVPVRLGRIIGEVVEQLLREGPASTASIPSSPVVHVRPHIRVRQYYKAGAAFSGNTNYGDTSSG
jgi:DNA (cytosine-5)-methyltransferase 1